MEFVEFKFLIDVLLSDVYSGGWENVICDKLGKDKHG